MFKQHKLLVKSLVVLLVLVPLIFMAYHLFYEDLKENRAAVEAKNLQTAELTAGYMDNLVNQITNTLISVAGSEAIRKNDVGEMTSILTDLRLSNPEVSLFFIADRHGNLRTTVPVKNDTTNIADRQFFQAALAGQEYSGGPFLGRVTGLKIVVFSVPYYQDNHIAGIVGASIPLNELQKKMAVIRADKTSYPFLLTKSRQFLTNPKPSETPSVNSPVLQTVVQGASGSMVINAPGDNQPELLSYVPLSRAPWVVVAVQPLTQFELAQEQYVIRNGFVLVFVLLFVIVGGRYLQLYRERLTAEQAQKAEKLALVGQLAAGMAHEIRNPLTAIKGFIQLIQGNRSQPVPDLYLNTILSELNRIEQIVSEMMILAKPSPIKYTQIDLVHLMGEVIDLLTPYALGQEISISLTCEPNLPCLEGEANQLKQVFINLIKNAMEAIETQGQIGITLASAKNANGITITIVDTGPGIPNTDLEKLGTPFFSTKDAGTGLGLTVTYRIIQNHQGEISVASSLGQGTTFTVLLPLQQNPHNKRL